MARPPPTHMVAALRDPARRLWTLWTAEVRAVLAPPSGRARLYARIAAMWAVEAAGLLALAWLLPAVAVDGAGWALLSIVLLQVLYATIRPVVVYLLLPLVILSLGLLVLVVNAVLLAAVDLIVPGLRIDGPFAVLVVVVGLSALNATTSYLLDLGEEGSYYRFVSQGLARRGRPVRLIDRPGFVIVQIDGLGHDILLDAIRTGRMPTLARWLREGTHRVDRWECALPSQTSASQAGILLGDDHDIPAFRWYEKEHDRLLVSNRPADAAEIERRHSSGRGLLSRGGSSIGNLVSGDAGRTVLTTSTIADLTPGVGRRSRDFLTFFINPYSATRVIFRMGLEIVTELREAHRQRVRGVEPRIDRRGSFPILRAVSCVLLRDLAVTTLIDDMYRGVAVSYADFVSYDEIAHHAGPERPEAVRALEEIDYQVAALERTAALAPRRYRFVVLSDHGQSLGATFRQRYGMTLEDLVRSLMTGRTTVEAATGPVEGWGHLNAFLGEVLGGRGPVARLSRALLGRRAHDGYVELGPGANTASGPGGSAPPVMSADAEPGAAAIGRGAGARPDLVVCASGNLALVYFPALPGRPTSEAIESAHPGLLERLATHPGIGFVLVRSERDGAVVLGAGGTRRLADDHLEGSDPLAPFGDRAADHLRRLDGYPHVGDLVVNSLVDEATGHVAAFEELVGSHGGLGGPQTAPFLLHPTDLDIGLRPLVGAPSIFGVLRRWIDETVAPGPGPVARTGAGPEEQARAASDTPAVGASSDA